MQSSSPRRLPGVSALSQIILAGGSEDISAQDMIDWIAPVLAGITGGYWLTGELIPSGRGQISATVRSGHFAHHLTLCRRFTRHKARPVLAILPTAQQTAVIMINDHAPQIMTLLDGVASWLYLFEVKDPRLTPLLMLLAESAAPERKQRRQTG